MTANVINLSKPGEPFKAIAFDVKRRTEVDITEALQDLAKKFTYDAEAAQLVVELRGMIDAAQAQAVKIQADFDDLTAALHQRDYAISEAERKLAEAQAEIDAVKAERDAALVRVAELETGATMTASPAPEPAPSTGRKSRRE